MEEKTEQINNYEFENAPEEPDKVPVKKNKENTDPWGEKSVTRKFVVIALAAAVLLNAALTAGITGTMLKKQSEEMYGMHGKGRPGNEMDFGGRQNGHGKITAPGDDQSTGQENEQPSKASIGIIIKEDSGVIVAQVTGEKAKKAGFKEGDKIVSVEGKSVAASDDLISEVQSHETGDTITLIVERDGQNVEIKTELE